MVVNWSWNWKINFRYIVFRTPLPLKTEWNSPEWLVAHAFLTYSYKQVKKKQRRQAAWNVGGFF